MDANGDPVPLAVGDTVSSKKVIFVPSPNYGGTSATVLTDTALSVGVWNHIAFDVNSSTDVVNTYINGVLDKTASGSETYTTGFEKLGWNGGSHYLGGDMAHVAFYNRQLSATEVLQNYNAMKGRFE